MSSPSMPGPWPNLPALPLRGNEKACLLFGEGATLAGSPAGDDLASGHSQTLPAYRTVIYRVFAYSFPRGAQTRRSETRSPYAGVARACLVAAHPGHFTT